MCSSLPGYDSWLERPYQDMIEESDRFVDWAEEEGYDLDNPEDIVLAEQNYEFWLQDQYEGQAEAQYEAAMERKYEEMQERAWDDRY